MITTAKTTISTILMTCLMLFASQALAQTNTQSVETTTQTPDGKLQKHAKRAVVNPNQQIMFELRNILVEQARIGQTPANSPMLADLQNLIQKYGVEKNSIVKVSNAGPGILTITLPDGAYRQLQPTYMMDLEVGPGQIDFYAANQQATVNFQLMKNGDCRFWDVDDQVHSVIQSGRNFYGQPRVFSHTLTPRVRGYYLEK